MMKVKVSVVAEYQALLQQQYQTLSGSLRKVADYVLAEPEALVFQTAQDVGQKIGVSETTVIRLAYAVGYKGYRALQADVRQALLSSNSSLSTYRQDKMAMDQQRPLYEQVMMKDQDHILQTVHDMDDTDFREAVHRLSEARQILAAGVRTSHAMAHWFVFVMNLIRGKTTLFNPGTDDVILQVADHDEQDVFVAFSFHRYAESTLQLSQALKQKGVYIIAVTDSAVAPITAEADVVFTMKQSARSTIDAAPITFSFLNALTSAVSMAQPDQFDERRQYYEQHHLQDFFAKGAGFYDKY